MLRFCKDRERGRTWLSRPRQRLGALIAPVLAACLCFVPVPTLADFAVSQWSLGVDVDSQPGPSDGRGFYAVQNPFTGAHSASISTAQAAAQYDISWLADSGDFNITAQLGRAGRQLRSGRRPAVRSTFRRQRTWR